MRRGAGVPVRILVALNLAAATFAMWAVSNPSRNTYWIWGVACNLTAIIAVLRSKHRNQ